MSVRNFVYSKDLVGSCGQYSVAICRFRYSKIHVAIFEDRCGDFRRSKYRLSKIDDRCHDVSTFEDRCVDPRRSMCWPSKIDVSTFGDRCVDLRRSMCRPSEIDVLTFEDRWSMVDVSAFEDRCEIRLLYLIKTLILYISCMRIAPRVCTSVLSLKDCKKATTLAVKK